MNRIPGLIASGVNAVPTIFVACVVSILLAVGQARAQSDSVRPALGKPVIAAQALLGEKKYAEALAKLAETDAVADKTPYESFVIERTRLVAAGGAGDVLLAEKSVEVVLASNRLPPAERVAMEGSLVGMFYRAKDSARTRKWATRYFEDGGGDPQIRAVLINTLYAAEDFAAAARELQIEIDASVASGRVPTEERYKLLASCALRLKDDGRYVVALEKLVKHYPSPAYWADLISRTTRRPGFAERLWLDSLRLQLVTGTLQDAADYMESARLELDAGFPVQARKVLDQGFAAGVLGSGPEASKHKLVRAQAVKAAETDALAAAASTVPVGAKDGGALVSTGLNLAFLGQFDKGLPMMEAGIGKGGLRFPEETKLRLGMAYVLAGQKNKALQTLGTVSGQDGAADLARLWILFAVRSLP